MRWRNPQEKLGDHALYPQTLMEPELLKGPLRGREKLSTGLRSATTVHHVQRIHRSNPAPLFTKTVSPNSGDGSILVFSLVSSSISNVISDFFHFRFLRKGGGGGGCIFNAVSDEMAVEVERRQWESSGGFQSSDSLLSGLGTSISCFFICKRTVHHPPSATK